MVFPTIHPPSSVLSTRRSTDLLVELSPELVRGVPLSNILRIFGKELQEQTSNVWRPALSRRTNHYNFFFSHDWRTPGWMKYLSLLIFLNGRAATVATCIAVFGVSVLTGWIERSPDGWTAWWLLLFYALEVLVLLFWQHARELWRPRLGFLDRMCIPQDDPEKKSQCVYGLASFLNKSDELIVLWSPRYFSRLWCVHLVWL